MIVPLDRRLFLQSPRTHFYKYINVMNMKLFTSISTGSADFLGMNHYTTNLISPVHYPPDVQSYDADKDATYEYDPSWPT